MLTKSRSRHQRTRTVLAAIAATLAVACLALALGTGGSSADAAKAKPATVLGGSDPMPEPRCPDNCLVIPSVSGIQNFLPSGGSPYRAPANGKITAWKLYLGKPTGKDRKLLNETFGAPPQAAITILQRIKTRDGMKFRLQRKSPVEGLNRELGGIATFRLDEPLRIKKGQFVALSVPTWAPAFAAALNKSHGWRASRQPSKCATSKASQARPQLKVGSKRFYACNFKGSRLLFTAKLKFD